MKYEQLAKDIIKNVGGTDNVINVIHCVTRLRFKLKDEDKANTDILKLMDGIVTVMKSGGQYQVVIGNHVPDVYKAVVEVGGFNSNTSEEVIESTEKKNLFNSFIEIISGIFTPALGVLAATGMIKGFNALFFALNLYSDTSGTYQILNALGDSLLHFFPIILGYTASIKFGGNKFIGMTLGAALVYPTLSTISTGDPMYTLFAGTIFESPIFITFLGIPVILMSYASTVIPIVIAAFFGVKLEKFFSKVIPDVVKTFLVPFFTLLFIVPLTFIVIGPIATWFSQLLGQASLWVLDISPIIAGFFLGSLWQVFVIFGIHWGITPIAINNLMTIGEDPILSMIFAASFAQIGAVLGVWIKTKQQKIKALSVPAFISGIFGVTEPAIYGITLPLKVPFIISCIASGVGGAITASFASKAYILSGLGIFQIPGFINPEEGINKGFWGNILAVFVAFILSFIFTYFFGLSKEKNIAEASKQVAAAKISNQNQVAGESEESDKILILSPLTGEVKSLSDISDAAFASGALGRGVAIEPSDGKLFSPVSGTVSALFPTKHAIGLKTEQGAEILIHIGMDTVQLGGENFLAHVSQGEHIEKGQILIEFDITEIKKAGYILTTPVVVTNPDSFQINTTKNLNVKAGNCLLELQMKNNG